MFPTIRPTARPVVRTPSRSPSPVRGNHQQRQPTAATRGRGPQSPSAQRPQGQQRPVAIQGGGWQASNQAVATRPTQTQQAPTTGSGWQNANQQGTQQSRPIRGGWPVQIDPNTGRPLGLRGGSNGVQMEINNLNQQRANKINEIQRLYSEYLRLDNEIKEGRFGGLWARYNNDDFGELDHSRYHEASRLIKDVIRTGKSLEEEVSKIDNRLVILNSPVIQAASYFKYLMG